MQVVKRNGLKEDVSFDKVLNRIRKQSESLEVNPTLIAQRTLSRIYDGVKTSELDELAAQLSISLMTTNIDYGILASRIIISNHHRNTSNKFTDVIETLSNQTHEKTGEKISIISHELVDICKKYGDEINAKIDYSRDYLFDYFGFKTLEKLKYLLHDVNGNPVERPQHLIMRVSLALWGSISIEQAFETYDLLSQKFFIHATPTNFNAGMPQQQLSSCYLIAMKTDSVNGIYDTLKDCALISKYSGGIGLHIHNIRAKGSIIKGTNGTSNGIVPMLKVFNDTARYINQSGKRNGSFAIYLEPWHADVEDFLKLKLNTGIEDERARDLFYALWIPDLFMKRVEEDGEWTLFCPNEAPGLADVWGAEFEELYSKYEKEGRGHKQVSAQKLWFKILDSQIETGTPYLLYKDAANAKSNQQNLGTIKSSNLCVAPETYILTDKGQQQISELVGKEVNVWNGDKWSKTTIMKTGENQKLIKVHLSNGAQITCTPYHKFIVRKNSNDKVLIKDATRIEASNLKEGMLMSAYNETDINAECFVTVVSVVDDGRIDDTYCFNEPENHAGVFNGILTGNCTEIIEYSSESETAVCNLASIALPAYVDSKSKKFNFDKLREVVKVAIRNLNRVIDINYYPTPETHTSNMRHRPVGLGVQGLADVFALMRVPWESDRATELNKRIFEHMYYASLESSSEIAEKEGYYPTFVGSPLSKGQLQYDLWNVTPLTETDSSLNWGGLKEKIMKTGVRNSLLIAPMPTASTSQILGYNECLEPFTSNIYTRRTLAGEFIVINKYLMKDLQKLELWNEDMKQQIIVRNGSIQGIDEIPQAIKNLYKTSWEIKQRTLIDMAADRGAFICQSQSLNLFVADPNYSKLTSMHFYGWKKGLKTGIYYLRTRAPVMAQKFTVDPELQKAADKSEHERNNKKYMAEEGCVMCSA